MTRPTTSASQPVGEAETTVQRILREGGLGMSAAARRLGHFRDGKPTHPSTVTRWARGGIPVPGGGRLRLEAVTLNGRLVTSWPAIERFVEAQQRGEAGGPEMRGPTARTRATAASVSELDTLGC